MSQSEIKFLKKFNKQKNDKTQKINNKKLTYDQNKLI